MPLKPPLQIKQMVCKTLISIQPMLQYQARPAGPLRACCRPAPLPAAAYTAGLCCCLATTDPLTRCPPCKRSTRAPPGPTTRA